MENEIRTFLCWFALVLAMLAWLPSLAPFTPAVLVTFITLPVGLACISATPRLAIATVYWSVATLVASPMFFDAPGELILSTLLGGMALGAGLSLDYWRKRCA